MARARAKARAHRPPASRSQPRARPHPTPLMRQWQRVKDQHPQDLVFFRVGDFFELFCEDAEEGSRLLGLTLTSRNNGAAQRVPLAGVPAKALRDYVDRLVRAGRKAVICDQVEDAFEAKGIVRREVVETVTPGTVVSDTLLDAGRNNFVVALAFADRRAAAAALTGSAKHAPAIGIAALDVTTGQVSVMGPSADELGHEIERLEPREVLVPQSLNDDETIGPALRSTIAAATDGTGLTTARPDWLFEEDAARDELVRRYRVHSLDGFGFEPGDEVLVRAAGAVIAYSEEVRPGAAAHLQAPRIQRSDRVMALDSMTRRNLELVEPLQPDRGQDSLLSVLDQTLTPMGARLLRRWVLAPRLDAGEIRGRLRAVAELVDDPGRRGEVRRALAGVRDLDRLATKVGSGRATPRELLALSQSIRRLPALAEAAATRRLPTLAAAAREDGASAATLSDRGDDRSEAAPHDRHDGTAATLGGPEWEPDPGLVANLLDGFDPLGEVEATIAGAIDRDAPVAIGEGDVIRAGFDPTLDELRQLRHGAEDFIAGLQAREREQTGIASLKVGQNRVFGYYLEVTNPNRDRVPAHYIRKQTLTSAERYFTTELKEWEEKVFDAADRIGQLERRIFAQVRGELAASVPRILDTSRRVAVLDVLACLAETAVRRDYVQPEITTEFGLRIAEGRHPVVETTLPGGHFIPNDLALDADGRIAVLTGPNMAGKSTVLRQTGLIQVMAQIGSFVPAASARLGLCDRVFTRVGASDNLAAGHSTFMVEMNETAAIIHGATERSLVLLDEIGRGTSTYDGVSIAWAVTEHLHDHVGAKAIFATHYHELAQLAGLLAGVKNLNVAVRESGDEIVFLRRLEEGGADRSYGIHVARLAGLPQSLLERARELLAELEGGGAGRAGLGRGGRARAPAASGPGRATGAAAQGATNGPGEPSDPAGSANQLSLFHAEHPVVARIRALDPDAITPRDALGVLYSLREAVMGKEEDGS